MTSMSIQIILMSCIRACKQVMETNIMTAMNLLTYLGYLGDVPQVFCALGTGSLAPFSFVTPLVSPPAGGH